MTAALTSNEFLAMFVWTAGIAKQFSALLLVFESLNRENKFDCILKARIFQTCNAVL